MPNMRVFGLLSGVVALIAIACRGSSADSADTLPGRPGPRPSARWAPATAWEGSSARRWAGRSWLSAGFLRSGYSVWRRWELRIGVALGHAGTG